MSSIQLIAVLALLGAVGLTSPSSAEVATIDVLLDLDNDSETGCGVVTVDGEVAGVELRVRTLFDVGTETVLSTASANCADPLLDLFDIESPIVSDPQPSWLGVAGNGVAGSMLIESHFPIALTGQVAAARSFVVVSSMVGEDTLFEGDAGSLLMVSLLPPVVPGVGLVAMGIMLVASIVVMRNGLETRVLGVVMVGGLIGSSLLVPESGWALFGEGFHRVWTLEERVGSDPEADAPVGIDLLEFYSAYDPVGQELWLRTDILFGTPVCLDWGVVDPGSGYACGMQPPLDVGPFGGAVAMTFDDGPHLTVTPLVLDTLRAHGIPATFFVVGNRMQTAAEQALVLEIHNDPLFRVANHSLTHRRMAFIPPGQIEAEVSENNDLIRAAIGDPCYFPRYFRFPYSSSNCETMAVVRTHGLASAAVHINTSDWCYGTNGGSCPAEVVSFIEDEFRDDLPGWAVHEFEESGGGILIMHDIHTNTAAELPAVISALQDAGATFVDLAEPVLFPIMNGTMMAPEGPACCAGTVN